MRILGNILWFLLGGLELGIVFIAEGLASFVTIIGIPFGLQWFKMVPLVFSPFGKGIRYNRVTGGRVLGNILWVIIFGWWNAVLCLVLGLVLCITIIGIPFGKQWFKLARLLFLPFGAEVYNEAAEKRQEKREHKRELAAASASNSYNSEYSNKTNSLLSKLSGSEPPKLTESSYTPDYSDKTNSLLSKLSGEEPKTLPMQDVAAEDFNGSWKCPNCGKPDNVSDGIFCVKCGYQRSVPQSINVSDLKDKAVDIGKKTADVAAQAGKKTAEIAAAVGVTASDIATNKVKPFINDKFIPAAKKTGEAVKAASIKTGGFIKEQWTKFVDFLIKHKENIKRAIPYIAAVVVGGIAVYAVVVFIGNASDKIEIAEAYNSKVQEHDNIVAEAEAIIQDCEKKTSETENDTVIVKNEVFAKKTSLSESEVKLSELQSEAIGLDEQIKQIEEENAAFKNLSDNYSTAEYAEQELQNIIINQQDMIYNLKISVSEDISCLYQDLNKISGYQGDFEYLYEVEPPMDVTGELAKNVIGKVAESFDSEIADFASGVASDMIDGDDFVTALGSQLQSTAQSELNAIVTGAIDTATGGAYSTFSDIVNTVDNFQTIYNRLTDTTPMYCVRHLYLEMQQCVTEIGAFLDDDCVTSEDLANLIKVLNKYTDALKNYQDIGGELFFSSYINVMSTNEQAQAAYGSMMNDNERMAYYFALMEE